MTEVTREQFEFTSELKVRHKPTNATFSTYRFPDPKNVDPSIVNPGRAGDCLPNGEEYDLADTSYR